MSRVTLDRAVWSQLQGLDQCVELCDESGRVLGYFAPHADRSLYQTVEVPFSSEELDRIEQEGRGRPLAEIFADLEKRS